MNVLLGTEIGLALLSLAIGIGFLTGLSPWRR